MAQVSSPSWHELLDDLAPATPRPLLRSEYDQLVAAGVFEGERVELLRGVVVQMSPQSALHMHVIDQLTKIFVPRLLGRATVRVQGPLAASDVSEPEPDVAVYPERDYSREHPSEALLLIEVAHSSLRLDRRVKGPLYAETGAPEYWIVDLNTRTVEVYTDPQAGSYQTRREFGRDETIQLLRFPDVSVAVAEFLPAAEAG